MCISVSVYTWVCVCVCVWQEEPHRPDGRRPEWLYSKPCRARPKVILWRKRPYFFSQPDTFLYNNLELMVDLPKTALSLTGDISKKKNCKSVVIPVFHPFPYKSLLCNLIGNKHVCSVLGLGKDTKRDHERSHYLLLPAPTPKTNN